MTSTASTIPAARQRLGLRRAAAVGSAVVAGLAVWVVAVPVLGIELTRGDGQLVGPGAVVVAGLVAGLGGWGLLALLERRVAPPRVAWTTTAVAVLVLSLAGPFAQTATTAAAAALAAMHVAVGTVVIAALGPTAGRAREETGRMSEQP